MKKTDRLCYHPGWPPYNAMTGEKILPGHVWECDCGGNSYCDICGFGHGACPCDCDRFKKTVQKYKNQFKDAWTELAS